MYCLPAVIYIGLSIIGIMYSVLNGLTSVGAIVLQVLFTWLFAWFLDYLCRNGYTIASWVLVLFPFIFLFALVFGVLMAAGAAGTLKVPTNNPETK